MKYIFLSLAILTLFACKKNHTDPAQQVFLDVAYGSDPKQKADIYRPVTPGTAANTPLVVLIHGGGWTEGDKADFTPFIAELQKRFPAYAFANINYRLFFNGQNQFPNQENDVKSALTFLMSKSGDYGYSQTVALLGASAGAHLALLQTYKYTSPVKIKAVVSFFGPTDLTALYNNPPNPLIPSLLASVVGATPSQNPTLYFQSSPSKFVDGKAAPTLLLHGGADIVVSPSQSVLLKDLLTGFGVPVEYYNYPMEGHGWTGDNLIDSYNKVEAFLKKYVQ